MRTLTIVLLALLILLLPAGAQAPTASINGRVVDQSRAAITGASVKAVNIRTELARSTATNDEGVFTFLDLPPGTYRLELSKAGFKTIVKPDIVLHVQDAIAINFVMPVGSVTESITVDAGAPLINTMNSSVGSVVDRTFVERLPLNGRSFNTLMQLTPGTVIAPSNSFSPGQFSVNGQRTSSNYFQVDGVSANFGVGPQANLGESGAGGVQAFNSFGGTSSLVSVDALQEFRIETSTFAPEYGRSPGAQVSITTRSGTNAFHGGVFDYFRNDAMDANDWFANHADLPRAALRQNDFGSFLGGPIIPNKTFFFASYEGLRLRLPRTSTILVPSLSARASAAPAIASLLNAYPMPSGAALSPNTAEFTGTFSDKSSMDAGSIRVDHMWNPQVSLFGRFNYSPSRNTVRGDTLSSLTDQNVDTLTGTTGLTTNFTSRIANNVRFNFSRQNASSDSRLDAFHGAVPFDLNVLLPSPLSPSTSRAALVLVEVPSLFVAKSADNREDQIQIVNDLGISLSRHQIKAGFDWRDLRLHQGGAPSLSYLSPMGISAVLAGSFPIVSAQNTGDIHALLRAVSVYMQDQWRVNDRVSLTYGLRWEIQPAPSGIDGTVIRTFDNLDQRDAITLAPAGTPLWNTRYSNVAPRIGLAVRPFSASQLVVRGGYGIFYDLGSGAFGSVISSFPNFAFGFQFGQPFPLTSAASVLPALPTTGPPFSFIIVPERDLRLPYSHQWNVAVEMPIAQHQAVAVTYVGQAGRRLLNQEFSFSPTSVAQRLQLTRNAASSDYHALQVQFNRVLRQGLQVRASYTWAHSIDDSSTASGSGIPVSVLPLSSDKGSSDFDARHNFVAAVTYDLPKVRYAKFAWLLDNWSIDGIVQARTSFPLSVFTNSVIIDPAQIFAAGIRPDLVPSVPVYLEDSTAPAGKVLNPAAFQIQTESRQGTLGRNAIRGFGLSQVDLSLQRRFPIHESLELQFRSDVFNVFNHPNFSNPQNNLDLGPLFGRSTSLLNRGLGGLSPLYQIGGPRSIQLSLKLIF